MGVGPVKEEKRHLPLLIKGSLECGIWGGHLCVAQCVPSGLMLKLALCPLRNVSLSPADHLVLMPKSTGQKALGSGSSPFASLADL